MSDTINLNTPIHLLGFDVFGNLYQWKTAASGYARSRSWEIRSYGKMSVVCRLCWTGNSGSFDGQLCSLEKGGASAKEAVYLAMAEFTRLETIFLGT